LESLYKGSLSAVRTNGDIGKWFETVVGVLQGCKLSPLQFNIFLEIIMAMALKDVEAGALMNGSIINNLRFADDIAAITESQDDLQMIVDNIVEASKSMGMRVNSEKTEVQCISAEKTQTSIHIENENLNQAENFVYLGGSISEDASTDTDVKRRIGLASGVMQKLIPLWKAKEISRETKVKVYEVLVISVLLYNSETWSLTEAAKRKLRVFEMGCLRQIKGITRRDRTRNEDIKA
jgi:Reverse transcriptase (RNA-dependent DNA polymerase)